jgi:hypothetical protein
MNEEVRDSEVALEVPAKAPTLDFGVLRKAEAGPSGAYWTRTLRNPASADSDGCILAWGRAARMEIPGRLVWRAGWFAGANGDAETSVVHARPGGLPTLVRM